VKRRGFLAGVVAAVGATLAGIAGVLIGRRRGKPEAAPACEPAPMAAIPRRYQTTLAALCGRLFPDDPETPGAGEAGVMRYLLRELGRGELAGTLRLVMRGAAQLDRLSAAHHGGNFAAARGEQQDAIIAAMLRGEGAAPRFDPARFIETMVSLTLEGMFADPRHGGNRDGVGWRLIGYAMHPPYPQACHDGAGLGGDGKR